MVASGLSCGDDEPETRTYQDVGDFCVKSEADGRLTFAVRVSPSERCLSSCRTNTASCRATLSGSRIELLSELKIRDNPEVELCSTDCVGTTGTCDLDAPPPGEYQFGFASRFDTLPLPTSASEGCVPLFADH